MSEQENEYSMGELFKEIRAAGQQKREHNRRYSTKLLTTLKVKFTSCNYGYHLIIEHNDEIIDFWPSTGLWKNRKTGMKKRGIKSLIGVLTHDKNGSSSI